MSNHSFDTRIAVEYKSVEIAILVSHFQYRIRQNKNLGRNLLEGKTWVNESIIKISANFPYWSTDQVRRLVDKAVKLNILIKRNFNESHASWFAFSDENKFINTNVSQMGGGK